MNRTNTLKLFLKIIEQRLNKLLDQVDINELEKVIDIMVKTFKSGNTLYVCEMEVVQQLRLIYKRISVSSCDILQNSDPRSGR